MDWRYFGALLLLVSLSVCAGPSPDAMDGKSEFCPQWTVGVVTPAYMETWVEALEVRDDRGGVFNIPQGMAEELDQTVGWGRIGPGANTGVYIRKSAPEEIYVRWQSLVEPQTYTWRFIVPDSLRKALTTEVPMVWQGKSVQGCRTNIAIGVAPGGHVVVWNAGLGFEPVEVMRGQADVEPLGPDQGKYGGRYVRIGDKAKQYIAEHGIPYDSWAPPASATIVTNADALAHPAPEPPPIDIAAHPEGTYVLSDLMEVASRVVLKADGSFQAGIELGAAYGTATGRWIKQGNTITLQRTSPGQPHPTRGGADDLSPLFDRMQLTIDGPCLRTGLMGASACYLRR